MSDPIDRDKLIDFIMESDPEWCIKPIRPIFDYIKEMPSAQPEQRWIPVTERLPENFERVIVWMSWGGFSMMDFQMGRFYPLNSVNPVPDEAVTAWMPLPEPYKGEQHD